MDDLEEAEQILGNLQQKLMILKKENKMLIKDLILFENVINEKRIEYLRKSDKEKLAYKIGLIEG